MNTMRNKTVWALGAALLALTSQASTNAVDFWAATEVVMSQVGPSTFEQIQRSPELQRQYEQVMLEQYLAQQAATRGLTERLDVQRALNVARRSVLVQALKDDLVRSIARPTEAEIKAAFPRGKDKWIQQAAYQLDVFPVPAADAKSLEAARALAHGRPVTDEELQAGLTLQPQITRASGAWITARQMPPEIWAGLREMKADTLRLFPDAAQTLVIRRGPYREERELNLQEASPYVAQDLMRERADRTWSNYIDQARARVLK